MHLHHTLPDWDGRRGPVIVLGNLNIERDFPERTYSKICTSWPTASNAPRCSGRDRTSPMDWGLFNDTYRHPWAFTYAGQFWTEMVFGESQPTELSNFDLRTRTVKDLLDSSTIPAGRWGYGKYALSQLSVAFQFAATLTSQFGDSEQVQINMSIRNIKDCWLEFEHSDKRGPCRAPSLGRQVRKTAAEFRKDWKADFAMVGKSFTDLFNRDGRSFSTDSILRICDLATE